MVMWLLGRFIILCTVCQHILFFSFLSLYVPSLATCLRPSHFVHVRLVLGNRAKEGQGVFPDIT